MADCVAPVVGCVGPVVVCVASAGGCEDSAGNCVAVTLVESVEIHKPIHVVFIYYHVGTSVSKTKPLHIDHSLSD